MHHSDHLPLRMRVVEGSKRMRKNYKKDINVILIMETLPYSSERLRLDDINHIQLQTIMLDDHIVHRLLLLVAYILIPIS